MKSAMRAGYLDFVVVVNTLDEALRALKNEVRQKRPLTVGLIAEIEATLTEMVERGVQPDLQLVSSDAQREDSSQIQTLWSRQNVIQPETACMGTIRRAQHLF